MASSPNPRDNQLLAALPRVLARWDEVIGLARQAGEANAINGKLILERVLPSSRPVRLDLPEILGPAELLDAEQKIARAMNEGRISPAEARHNPMMVRNVVVLPAPLRPSSIVVRPSGTPRSTPCRM